MTTHAGTADVNGVTLAYETAGSGTPIVDTPVVLIHAGIADSRMWDDFFNEAAESFTVVRYDLRGFGRSSTAEAKFSHPDDLAALLLHLGIDRAALVGCSMGSKTALDFALQHPERVERLVLTSPSVSGFRYDGPPPRQAAELEAADEAGDLARVNELEMQIWIDGPHRGPDEVDPRVRALAAEMNAIALSNEGVGDELPVASAVGRLGGVRVPALIVLGELDAARTAAGAEHLAANLPDARKVIIPDAAHLPNMEQPVAYNQIVTEFLGAASRP